MKAVTYWRILACCRFAERVLLVLVILLTPLMWVLDAGIAKVIVVWVISATLFVTATVTRIRLAKKGPPR